MSISYDGIGYLAVTMPANNCIAGHVCTIDSRGVAIPCDTGAKFCGVVSAVEMGMASVQVEGFAELSFTGTAPVPGYVNLAGNGAGHVAVNTAGNSYLVVAVDTAKKTLVCKL